LNEGLMQNLCKHPI